MCSVHATVMRLVTVCDPVCHSIYSSHLHLGVETSTKNIVQKMSVSILLIPTVKINHGTLLKETADSIVSATTLNNRFIQT